MPLVTTVAAFPFTRFDIPILSLQKLSFMKTKSPLLCLLFAICTNTFITVYSQAVNKQDSLALVDLYK
jgi:hypothetical protein